MTVEITPDLIHSGILGLLLLLQVWHHYRLNKQIEKTDLQLGQVWLQISTLVTSVAGKLAELEKRIDDKVGKEDKTL